MRGWRGALVCGSVLLAGPTARAGAEARLGLGVGVAADVPDAASQGETRMAPGPSLSVPLKVELVPALRFRADLRFQAARGVDELTWTRQVDGADVRFTDADGHLAILGAVGLDLGLEAAVPIGGPARPYLGFGGGVHGLGMFHALSDQTAVLLDPDQNDLGNPKNLDPFTVQAVGNVFVALGLDVTVAPRVELWVETGYSAAFVGPRALRKTPPDFDARREAFAFNPFRAELGFTFLLQGTRARAAAGTP